MKKTSFLILIIFISCKKGGLPSNSTSASLQVTYADGRKYSFSDYSVPGGPVGNTIDNGIAGSTSPIDYLVNVSAPAQCYLYHFNGYREKGLYNLTFSTPQSYDIENYNEDLANYPSLSGACAQLFSFLLNDTFYMASKLQVSLAGQTNGSFTITFIPDSLVFSSGKMLYNSQLPITLKGSFNNVKLMQ